MIGLFSLISTGISTIYPIFASFRSFENYQKSASAVSSGNLNIGGIQVPIVSLLRRATTTSTDPSDPLYHQEELLQSRLLSTQKWLVYWIVYAAYSIVESVLFLKYTVPLYSLWKCIFFAWLIYPIFTSPEDISTTNISKDWMSFSERGCGLCYYQYLKPWLEGEVSLLNSYDLNKLSGHISENVKLIFGFFTMFLSKITNSNPGDTSSNLSSLTSKIVENGGSFLHLSQYFPQAGPSVNPIETSATSTSIHTSTTELEDEYDMIDRPIDDTLKSRNKPEVHENMHKKGWIW
ncbi:hypothetical protein CAAN3_07S05666 [[Candida] anglica]